MAFSTTSFARLSAAALTCSALLAPVIAQEVPEAQGSGEVRRVNPDQGKIVIKQDAISELDLPAMSLSYHIQPELLQGIQPGDKVDFTAKRENSRYIIVEISK